MPSETLPNKCKKLRMKEKCRNFIKLFSLKFTMRLCLFIYTHVKTLGALAHVI